MNCIKVFALTFGIASCSLHKSAITELSSSNDCENAEAKLSGMEFETKAVGRAKQAGGTAVSLVLSGAGYIQDSVLFVVGDVVTPVTICTIAIPFDVLSIMYIGGRPGAIEACGMSLKQAKRQSSGNATFEKTADLRNLDLSPLSEAIRQVATCYQKRGDDENRSKALGLLQQINTNEGFFAGLSAEERHALQLQIKSLRPSGSDLTPAAEQVPVIKSKPATKLALSKTESQLLGSWRSDTGTIINGGDDKALNGKKIAGTVDITIGEGEMTINSVMATKLPIAFVTNDDRAKAAFKSEIAAGGKNYAIIKFLSSGILEHFAISGDGKALDSTRIVPSIRTDGEARAQRITRTWLRAK